MTIEKELDAVVKVTGTGKDIILRIIVEALNGHDVGDLKITTDFWGWNIIQSAERDVSLTGKVQLKYDES